MRSLEHWWQMGGPGMYLILLLLLAGLFMGTAALAAGVFLKGKAAPALAAGLAGSLMFLTLCSGVVVRERSMRRVDQAIAFADPSYREMIRAEGSREANVPLQFAIGAALCPGISFIVLGGIFLSRKQAIRTDWDR